MLNLLLAFIAGVLFEAVCTAIARVVQKKRSFQKALDEWNKNPRQNLPHLMQQHDKAFRGWSLNTPEEQSVQKDD
jgi:hypothetical protein